MKLILFLYLTLFEFCNGILNHSLTYGELKKVQNELEDVIFEMIYKIMGIVAGFYALLLLLITVKRYFKKKFKKCKKRFDQNDIPLNDV